MNELWTALLLCRDLLRHSRACQACDTRPDCCPRGGHCPLWEDPDHCPRCAVIARLQHADTELHRRQHAHLPALPGRQPFQVPELHRHHLAH